MGKTTGKASGSASGSAGHRTGEEQALSHRKAAVITPGSAGHQTGERQNPTAEILADVSGNVIKHPPESRSPDRQKRAIRLFQDKTMTPRYHDWKNQGINDLEWAQYSLQGGFFAQACFISQQAAEKLFKSLCFMQGLDLVKTHSLAQIVQLLQINGELEELAKELDIYYIAGRYPDAFPAGAPFEMITRAQAEKALGAAERVASIVLDMIEKLQSDG